MSGADEPDGPVGEPDDPFADFDPDTFDVEAFLATEPAPAPEEPTPPSAPTRRKRVPYFQRPKQPHDWRWVVGGIGRTLITLGLLMFAFVGYQLWGTGIQTARAQNSLESDWNRLMEATTTSPTTTSTLPAPTTTVAGGVAPATTDSTAPTTSTLPVAAPPPTGNGDVVARLMIPKIDLDWFVVQGVTKNDLAKGPGHFRETPMPGQLGNAAIAGHRTTHGAPFGDLDELEPGDQITVETLSGTFVYEVTNTLIVNPDEYGLVIPTADPTIATLTLATCHPEYTSKQRLVVQATLVSVENGQLMAPPPITLERDTDDLPDEGAETTTIAPAPETSTAPGDTTPGDTTPGDTTPTTSAAVTTTTGAATTDTVAPTAVKLEDDGFSGGWFDDSAAIPHAILWGLALLAVGIGAYFVGKRFQRLYVCFLVGFVPFVVVLYFFFENVNRLLPPGL